MVTDPTEIGGGHQTRMDHPIREITRLLVDQKIPSAEDQCREGVRSEEACDLVASLQKQVSTNTKAEIRNWLWSLCQPSERDQDADAEPSPWRHALATGPLPPRTERRKQQRR